MEGLHSLERIVHEDTQINGICIVHKGVEGAGRKMMKNKTNLSYEINVPEKKLLDLY